MFEIRYGPHGGVLWIDAQRDGYSVRMMGYCNYWVTDDSMGGFACDDHADTGRVMYRWELDRFQGYHNYTRPDAPVMPGEWVPDDEWEALTSGKP